MKAKAKIYKPAKTAMSSGRAKTKHWVLEFVPAAAMTPEALMGWNTMRDTTRQVQLRFETQDAAEAYAQKKGIAYELHVPHERVYTPKSYAANFAFSRQLPFAKSS